MSPRLTPVPKRAVTITKRRIERGNARREIAARRLLVEPRFEENFAAALIAAIFHRQTQQCRPTSVKKTNVSGSILRGRERRYRAGRACKRNALHARPGSIKRGLIIDGVLKRYEHGDKTRWAYGAVEVPT